MTRAGNDRAFEAIVDPLQGGFWSATARGFCPTDGADDAVQQTFVNAYGALHGDTTPLALRSWLFGIAHNVSLNFLRQRGSDHEPLEAYPGTAEPAHATIEKRERFREVLAAVAALPPGQRDAIVLRELEGRGHDEIARELGVTGGAARQLISRARNELRQAAAVILPMPLLMRLTSGTAPSPTAERVAELTAVGGGITVGKGGGNRRRRRDAARRRGHRDRTSSRATATVDSPTSRKPPPPTRATPPRPARRRPRRVNNRGPNRAQDDDGQTRAAKRR